jgi:hypothetical protein
MGTCQLVQEPVEVAPEQIEVNGDLVRPGHAGARLG